MQYLTAQIVLTKRKTSLITLNCFNFPSIVKNNGKGGLKLSKVRKEAKWLPQIFRKDLTEAKLERIRAIIKVMLSTSPA